MLVSTRSSALAEVGVTLVGADIRFLKFRERQMFFIWVKFLSPLSSMSTLKSPMNMISCPPRLSSSFSKVFQSSTGEFGGR